MPARLGSSRLASGLGGAGTWSTIFLAHHGRHYGPPSLWPTSTIKTSTSSPVRTFTSARLDSSQSSGRQADLLGDEQAELPPGAASPYSTQGV